MSSIDTKTILAGIRENNARLQSCDVHRFPAGYPGIGKRYRCEKCGGEVDAGAILNYCAGFAAAGGDPVIIWPDYQVTKTAVLGAIEKL